jgi:GGDEF domain-containing protein
VDARIDGPLFATDIALSFSDAIANAWIMEQVNNASSAYRIVDPHLEMSLGALVIEAGGRAKDGAWGEVLRKNADAGLYRVAVEWRARENGSVAFPEGLTQ